MNSRRRLAVVSPPAEPQASPERDVLARLARLAGELHSELARLAAGPAAPPGPLMEAPPRWQAPKWLAYEYGVAPRTIIRWSHRAGVGRKLAGRWLIDADALALWLSSASIDH